MTEIKEMPALQAEDDGFLLQLKWSILEKHLKTLEIDACSDIEQCIEKILCDSAYATDKGASLPIYIPKRDENSTIRWYSAKPVWAGQHIEIPLYDDLCPSLVEELITTGEKNKEGLPKEFMSYSPAFRVALLVHHICQVLVLSPMAAETFVLGRYSELPFDDSHFEEYGVPSTKLYMVSSNCGTTKEWEANSPFSFSGVHKQYPRINGWRVRVRGSQPKAALLNEAWQTIRSRLDESHATHYDTDGTLLRYPKAAPSGRSRKRAGDPAVDTLYSWVETNLDAKQFPMRGSYKDWKAAYKIFGEKYPHLKNYWTVESMRKAYERRLRRGY